MNEAEQRAMQAYVRQRQQALSDWLSQASPEALRELQPSYAEGEILPPTPGQQLTSDIGVAEQQAVRGEPKRDQALDDAVAWRDQGWRGPPGMRAPSGQSLPSAQAHENRYVGEPISDVFQSEPTVQRPQFSLSVPMGYAYDPSWGRPPPIGPALRGSILGGPGQPQLNLKPTELPQPGLMFRMQIPF